MTNLDSTPQERLARAMVSLDGLSIGDAFGQRFFDEEDIIAEAIEGRLLPATPWWYTDDTMMAMSVVDTLRRHGAVDQKALARSLADNYDMTRGYGPAMHSLLYEIGRSPASWERLAQALFHGQGSFGNGSAMRVAPLGAYFADDIDTVVREAEKSARVTHTHAEAVAGAIAVAVGAALACRYRGQTPPSRPDFIGQVLEFVPDGRVRDMVYRAQGLDEGSSVRHAVATLGNGVEISCADTVPFSLWCAGEQMSSYEEAMWLTVEGLGDRDTTCAIVGGIVAGYVGVDGIPAEWRESREELPSWVYGA